MRRTYRSEFKRLLRVKGTDVEQNTGLLIGKIVCRGGIFTVNIAPLHLNANGLLVIRKEKNVQIPRLPGKNPQFELQSSNIRSFPKSTYHFHNR